MIINTELTNKVRPIIRYSQIIVLKVIFFFLAEAANNFYSIFRIKKIDLSASLSLMLLPSSFLPKSSRNI